MRCNLAYDITEDKLSNKVNLERRKIGNRRGLRGCCTACTRKDNPNQLLLIWSSLLLTPLVESCRFSIVDTLLYMIGYLTKATPWEYKGARVFAIDFWRESGEQLGVGAVLGFFEHDTLVEGIRQKSSQKGKKHPEDRRRIASYHDHALNG